MNRWQFIFIILQISDKILSYPLEEPILDDPELTENYYQGDIEYPPIKSRNGIHSETFRWPNGLVYYHIGERQFDQDQKKHIELAMDIISGFSCIRFQEVPSSATSYLNITSYKPGCSVDKIGWENNVRNMNLKSNNVGFGCFRLGTILHELLHVLGFKHQHVAANRDEYIYIHWKNIKPKYWNDFLHDHKKQPLHNFGEDYDYNSVMHYSRYAFTIDRKLMTIEPIKKGGERMGQRIFLSKKDITKLNEMYKCELRGNLPKSYLQI
ncbi:seminal metalloprotease 1-like [Drosophila willistoni]|uniref:seminal metalloprotease 1-like n=1 Tax=Drosophila willistoni TaxID=7260 RepID=UPI001F07A516|nr:seminal metalloprotease 1-like [Drosophila willistoni]